MHLTVEEAPITKTASYTDAFMGHDEPIYHVILRLGSYTTVFNAYVPERMLHDTVATAVQLYRELEGPSMAADDDWTAREKAAESDAVVEAE
jgi:hypothetical protein